jgi:hypothetical protein
MRILFLMLTFTLPFLPLFSEIKRISARIIYVGNAPFHRAAIQSKEFLYLIKNPDLKLRDCQLAVCHFTIKINHSEPVEKKTVLVDIISYQLKP